MANRAREETRCGPISGELQRRAGGFWPGNLVTGGLAWRAAPRFASGRNAGRWLRPARGPLAQCGSSAAACIRRRRGSPSRQRPGRALEGLARPGRVRRLIDFFISLAPPHTPGSPPRPRRMPPARPPARAACRRLAPPPRAGSTRRRAPLRAPAHAGGPSPAPGHGAAAVAPRRAGCGARCPGEGDTARGGAAERTHGAGRARRRGPCRQAGRALRWAGRRMEGPGGGPLERG